MKKQIAIALGMLAVSANVAGLCLAAVEFDSPARISGVTDKDPLTYAPGEKMTFTLKLADLGQAIPKDGRIWWKQKSINWVQGSTHAYVPPKP